MNTLALLPIPRELHATAQTCHLNPAGLIWIDDPAPQTLLSAAQRAQTALAQDGVVLPIHAADPLAQAVVTLRLAPQRAVHPQGYRLHITPAGVTIEGHDPAGVFYGVCTLAQILAQTATAAPLPCLEINDYPDIPARGVMLDISRDKVYRLETLYELIDRLAGWKINQVQLYTEHTFAYRAHAVVWEKASPLTGEDVLALDAYCRDRFIELVPNQNSFGHMERWLVHEPYRALAETHDTYSVPWGTMKGPFTLAPENPASLALITSLYDELLPHFTSRQVNVGADETWDLGKGATQAACEERGRGRVYLDFVLKLYADLKRRGYTMQFWGDIILQHPELVPELPRDLIALSWGYEARHPFDLEGAAFAASGIPFYVCPGTSAWNTIAGRTENALANLLNAAESGVKHGAVGYLITDWGDNGHWQAPFVSLPGFAAGAALAWAVDANRDADWADLVGRFAFDDPTARMGAAVLALGNVYRAVGFEPGNASALFHFLQSPLERIPAYAQEMGADAGAVKSAMEGVLDAIDDAEALASGAEMGRVDQAVLRKEFHFSARLLRHAARRAMLAFNPGAVNEQAALSADLRNLMTEFEALWAERARPGGLPEALARFDSALKDYQA